MCVEYAQLSLGEGAWKKGGTRAAWRIEYPLLPAVTVPDDWMLAMFVRRDSDTPSIIRARIVRAIASLRLLSDVL